MNQLGKFLSSISSNNNAQMCMHACMHFNIWEIQSTRMFLWMIHYACKFILIGLIEIRLEGKEGK